MVETRAVIRFIKLKSILLGILVLVGAGGIFFYKDVYRAYRRRELVMLMTDLDKLLEAEATMEEVGQEFEGAWNVEEISNFENRIVWRMKVLRYEGRGQSVYYLEFDPMTRRLKNVHRLIID